MMFILLRVAQTRLGLNNSSSFLLKWAVQEQPLWFVHFQSSLLHWKRVKDCNEHVVYLEVLLAIRAEKTYMQIIFLITDYLCIGFLIMIA